MFISRRNLKGGVMTASMLTGTALLPSHESAGKFVQTRFPQHAPLGKGFGLFPGRVVWVHNPKAVSWSEQGYWWEPEHFSESAILTMLRDGICRLSGQPEAKTGWQALFQWHNESRNKNGGYKPGQKIAIKANMNGAGAYSNDPRGQTHESYTCPVLIKALLSSLIADAGVTPEDITVYDAGRIIPEYLREMCQSVLLTGIQFRHRNPNGPLDALADPTVPMRWSHPVSGETSYLPRCVTEAEYLINLASLKGHCYGITLCGKNHFGSLINSNRMRAPQAAGLHAFVASSRMGDYAVLTDLMAHHQLGGKTLLYMLDGLLTAPLVVTHQNA